MAKNLRTKIPSSDTLIIYDRNEEATTRFVQELGKTAGEGIEVATSVRNVAERAVRFPIPQIARAAFSCLTILQWPYMMIYQVFKTEMI